MKVLLSVLILGLVIVFTVDQPLDNGVSFNRVGDRTLCPSDVVTLECSVTGETLDWYCTDGSCRTIDCPAENVLSLECDNRTYAFGDCKQNGTVITQSVFFNLSFEYAVLTCRDGVETNKNKTLNITIEAPPSPILVLDDKIDEANMLHAINIYWQESANIQEAAYEVSVSPALQERHTPFTTQELSIMLKLAAHITYIVKIKTIACDGHLNSSESQPLIITLSEPSRIKWCSATLVNEDGYRTHKNVQWNSLPASQNISGDVNIPLLHYYLNYSVNNTIYLQSIQPDTCNTICSFNVNASARNISVYGKNTVGIGEMEPCIAGTTGKGTNSSSGQMPIGIAIGVSIGTAAAIFAVTATVICYLCKKRRTLSLKHQSGATTWETSERDAETHKMQAGRAIIHEGAMYINCCWCNVICKYNLSNKTWEKVGEPLKVYSCGLAVIKGLITCIGGYEREEDLGEHHNHSQQDFRKGTPVKTVLSWINNKWDKIFADLLEPRSDPAVLTHIKYIIVIGGNSKNAAVKNWLDSVELLNTEDKEEPTWQAVSSTPKPLRGVEATMCNNFIYAFSVQGGERSFKCSLTELADSNGNTNPKKVWKRMKSLPMDCSTPATIGHCIISVGGEKDKKFSNNIFKYEPICNRWKKLDGATLSVKRSTCIVAATTAFLVVVGGTTAKQEESGVVDIFECST